MASIRWRLIFEEIRYVQNGKGLDTFGKRSEYKEGKRKYLTFDKSCVEFYEFLIWKILKPWPPRSLHYPLTVIVDEASCHFDNIRLWILHDTKSLIKSSQVSSGFLLLNTAATRYGRHRALEKRILLENESFHPYFFRVLWAAIIWQTGFRTRSAHVNICVAFTSVAHDHVAWSPQQVDYKFIWSRANFFLSRSLLFF